MGGLNTKPHQSADASEHPSSSITRSSEGPRGEIDGCSEDGAGFERLAAERERTLQRVEHVAAVQRLREAGKIGVVVWTATGALDYWVAEVLGVGELHYFWALRAVAVGPGLFAVYRLSRPPLPSKSMLRVIDVGIFTLVAALVSLMCLRFGGIASPYATGISVILVARGATLFEPWRVGIWAFGVPALTFPATMVVAGVLDAEIQAQLSNRRDFGLFVTHLVFLSTTWFLLTVGGNFVHGFRRAALETRNIDRYRLVRRLGSGGMGEVWEAQDLTLRYRVALKLLRVHRQDGASVIRFRREVKALASLTHPNTVRIFDWGVTEDGLWYYAMEYLEGTSLREVVAREGPLPADRVLRIAQQILGALAEAHGRGLVHRDVKAHNILVKDMAGGPDIAKLIDFGIARFVLDEDVSLTRSNCVPGTPAYLAPEIISGRAADERSDLYSLGVTLYFALTGRLPFAAGDVAELCRAHLSETPPSLSANAPGPVPNGLRMVVERCLAKLPAERFESAEAALHALEVA